MGVRRKMKWKCPICQKENQNKWKCDCGFDESKNYEKYRTILPLSKFNLENYMEGKKNKSCKLDKMKFVMEFGAAYTRIARWNRELEKVSIILEIPSFIGWSEKKKQWIVGEEIKKLHLTSSQNVFSIMDLILHAKSVCIDGEKIYSNVLIVEFFKNIKERVKNATGYICKIDMMIVPDTLSYKQGNQLQASCEKIMRTPIRRMIGYTRAVAIRQYWDNCNLEENFIVCHIGDIISELAVFQAGEGVIEVLSTSTIKKLSGRKLNSKLVDTCYEIAKNNLGIELPSTDEFSNQLYRTIEYMKTSWNSYGSIFIPLPYGAGISYIELSQECLQRIIREMILSLKKVIYETIETADAEWVRHKEINRIIIAGNFSAMFGIEKQLYECMKCESIIIEKVDMMAAIEGAVFQELKLDGVKKFSKFLLLDASVENYGIVYSKSNGKIIIKKNTNIPIKGKISIEKDGMIYSRVKVKKLGSLYSELETVELNEDRIFWITVGMDDNPANNLKIEPIFIDEKYDCVEVIFDIAHKYAFNWKITPNVQIGDIIKFGKNSTEWIVLDKRENKALLLAKDVMAYKKYNEERDVTWENCTLREWLNEEFIQQNFSVEERKKIQTVLLKNVRVSENEIIREKDTRDKIFCLSLEELEKYFENREDKVSSFSWWLRSKGDYKNWAFIRRGCQNIINIIDQAEVEDENGVRPAMWIKLEEPTQISGKFIGGLKKNKSEIQIGETIKFGKNHREWIVLDKQENENTVLIVTKDIVDEKPYEDRDTIWAECTLRKWLNEEFLQENFSREEIEKIEITLLKNSEENRIRGLLLEEEVSWMKKPETALKKGKDTQDKIFCLSLEEVQKYLEDDELRKIGKNWWLRSPGIFRYSAALVEDSGEVDDEGASASNEIKEIGVRPALWLNLEK